MKKKIKIAGVGLKFGEHVIRQMVDNGMASPFVELGGVFDLDAERTREVAQLFGTRAYGSLDEILADPEIEAVGLFTPPAGRAELIRKVIRSGRHVMTTKPFELNAAEALSVLTEAREIGRIVHLNSPGPLPDPETQQILEWQREFQLGQPVAVRWETYANYREKADGSWYDDPQRCPVAPIFRLGIYGINQLLRLCGRVESVAVAHNRLFTGRPTPDNAELSLVFANGALGSIFASFCVDDGYRYSDVLCVHYERGTIMTRALEVDAMDIVSEKELILHGRGPDGTPVRLREERTGYGSLNNYQWETFFRAVRGGGTVPGEITPEEIAHAVELIGAMRQADRATGRISLSPADAQAVSGKQK
jgi:predicted dehydrogenase